jgi:hypothetical protein
MSNATDLMGLGMPAELAQAVANIATGYVANTDYFQSRNAANSADLGLLRADASDNTELNAGTGKNVEVTINGTVEATFDSAGLTLASGNTLKLDVGTIAAAGTDNTNATAIVDQLTYVTASDGTKGVILPSGSIGEIYVVHNTVNAQNLKLYPPASGTINGGTATTGNVVVAGEETAILMKVAANTWFGGVCVDF